MRDRAEEAETERKCRREKERRRRTWKKKIGETRAVSEYTNIIMHHHHHHLVCLTHMFIRFIIKEKPSNIDLSKIFIE